MIENILEQYNDFLKKLWINIKLETEKENLLIFDRCTDSDFVQFVRMVSTGPPNSWDNLEEFFSC